MRRRYHTEPTPTLTAALEDYRVAELSALARLVVRQVPTRKAHLVRVIAESLADAPLPALLARLDGLQHKAVAEAVHNWRGEYRPEAFRAKYGREPDMGKASAFNLGRPSLLRLFLHPAEPGGPLRVPDDLLRTLGRLVPAPPAATLETADEPPEHHPIPVLEYDAKARRYETRLVQVELELRETEVAARHDLAAVLALVDAGKVAVTDKKRQPTGAAVRAVARVLQDGDFYDAPGKPAPGRRRQRGSADDAGGPGPIRAFAWPMLLQAGGLARPWSGKLRLTSAGRAALAADPVQVLCDLWQRWQENDLLDEFSRIEAIRGQSGKGRRGLTPADERREPIAAALAACPPGRWVAVNEFWRFMRAAGHDFQVTRDLWNLYIAEKEYGSLGYEGYGKWQYLQGRYVLAVLFEYGATLGLVDVAYGHPAGARRDYGELWGTDDLDFLSRYDGLHGFRLTPLGAYCLGVTERYRPLQPESRPALTVMPNLEVAALDGAAVRPADRLVLDRFAVGVSERVWRLDRDRILAAVEDGHAVGMLRELLGARSDAPLPDTVVRFLDDLEVRAGLLRDAGAARLIDCTEPELAARIASDPATRRFCLLAGDRHVAVAAGGEAAFRKALRSLGYVLPGAAVR